MTTSREENFLLYDYREVNQEFMDSAIENYSQLRNYHGVEITTKLRATGIMLANVVAGTLNVTVITRGHPHYHTGLFPSYILITSLYNTIFTAGVEHYQEHYWERHTGNLGLLEYSGHGNHFLNFFYCADIKAEQESTCDFSIFTKTMDNWSWYLLITCIVAASVVQRPLNFLRNLIFNAEALLSPGASGGCKKSGLFVLWLFMCNVLVTFYSGDMTSHVITPTKEETIENITELSEEGYKLVFVNQVDIFLIGATVMTTGKASVLKPEIRHLSKLMETAEMKAELNMIEGNDAAVVKYLVKAVSKRFASVCSSPFALLSISEGNNVIYETSKQTKQIWKRKCHAGKKLIPVSETFTAFLPPGNEPVSRVYLRMLDYGVIAYWMREFMGLGIAARVQDRVRYKSPIDVAEPFERHVVSIPLKDKIVTIFLLWIVCLITCLVSLLLELIHSRCRAMNVAQYT